MLAMGEMLEDPRQLLDDLQDLYFPSQSRKATIEDQAAYIRAFEDVDWSEVFGVVDGARDFDDERQARQEDNLLKHYTENPYEQ
jgi:hypothetical protein